jgi:hypothetical protein
MSGGRGEKTSLALLATGWTALVFGGLGLSLAILSQVTAVDGDEAFLAPGSGVTVWLSIASWLLLLAMALGAVGGLGLLLRLGGVGDPSAVRSELEPIRSVDVDGLRRRTGRGSVLVWWTMPPHVAVDLRLRSTPRLRGFHLWVAAVELRLLDRHTTRRVFQTANSTGVGLLLYVCSPRLFLSDSSARSRLPTGTAPRLTPGRAGRIGGVEATTFDH